jgi:hypothetical protein
VLTPAWPWGTPSGLTGVARALGSVRDMKKLLLLVVVLSLGGFAFKKLKTP